MGLDTYAVRVKMGTVDSELFKDVKGLCGGIFSGNGTASFRGKVYDEVVKEATGASLYQMLILPEEVKRMSEAYDRWLEKHGENDYHGGYDISYAELVELGKFLKVCKENGLGLYGWW